VWECLNVCLFVQAKLGVYSKLGVQGVWVCGCVEWFV
jgi:hypothetical protein